jgi:hypothetical protein
MVHSVVFINDTSLSFDDLKDFNIVTHSEFLGFMNLCNTGHKHEAECTMMTYKLFKCRTWDTYEHYPHNIFDKTIISVLQLMDTTMAEIVLSENKILNKTKNHNPLPPFKLNGRSLTYICLVYFVIYLYFDS